MGHLEKISIPKEPMEGHVVPTVEQATKYQAHTGTPSSEIQGRQCKDLQGEETPKHPLRMSLHLHVC